MLGKRFYHYYLAFDAINILLGSFDKQPLQVWVQKAPVVTVLASSNPLR